MKPATAQISPKLMEMVSITVSRSKDKWSSWQPYKGHWGFTKEQTEDLHMMILEDCVRQWRAYHEAEQQQAWGYIWASLRRSAQEHSIKLFLDHRPDLRLITPKQVKDLWEAVKAREDILSRTIPEERQDMIRAWCEAPDKKLQPWLTTTYPNVPYSTAQWSVKQFGILMQLQHERETNG